jgi:hypothetical protein
MDRLLNEEEKETALLGIPACGDNPKRNLLQHKHAADRISEAQDIKTLKAMREWLEHLPVDPARVAAYLADFDIMMGMRTGGKQ